MITFSSTVNVLIRPMNRAPSAKSALASRVATAPAPDPVERIDPNPIGRGGLDARAEVAAVARRHASEHPGGGAADDAPRGVEALDQQGHPIRDVTALEVVDVPADRRSLRIRTDLELDAKDPLEALRRVVVGPRARDPDRQDDGCEHGCRTESTHRRLLVS